MNNTKTTTAQNHLEHVLANKNKELKFLRKEIYELKSSIEEVKTQNFIRGLMVGVYILIGAMWAVSLSR